MTSIFLKFIISKLLLTFIQIYCFSANESPYEYPLSLHEKAHAAYTNAEKFLQDDHHPIHHSINEAQVQHIFNDFKDALDGKGIYSHLQSIEQLHSLQPVNDDKKAHQRPIAIRKEGIPINKTNNQKKPSRYATTKENSTRNVMYRYNFDRPTASKIVSHELNRRRKKRLGRSVSTLYINGKPFDTSNENIMHHGTKPKKGNIKKA